MTTKIPIAAIGEYMEDEVDRLVRAVVLLCILQHNLEPLEVGVYVCY